MGRDRYSIHNPDAPHFLTFAVVQWLPLFAQPANAYILLDSLRFLQYERAFLLHGYVIMENHCHILAAGPALAQSVASFKSFTAKRIVARMQERRSPALDLLAWHKTRHKRDREHQVWQEGSHPEQIQDEAMMRQKWSTFTITRSSADTWTTRCIGDTRALGIMPGTWD
jgi:putative transposase